MSYRLLADLVVVTHLAFVLFVVLGGVLVLRYPRLLRWHLAALAWGLVVEWADWICPLTLLENQLRQWSGQDGYGGGFIEYYVMPLLYPDGLTLQRRYLLALVLALFNAAVYAAVVRQRRLAHRPVAGGQQLPPA